MELNELIFLGACAQLPKVNASRRLPDNTDIHDDANENILAVRRAEAVWEFIIKAGF